MVAYGVGRRCNCDGFDALAQSVLAPGNAEKKGIGTFEREGGSLEFGFGIKNIPGADAEEG